MSSVLPTQDDYLTYNQTDDTSDDVASAFAGPLDILGIGGAAKNRKADRAIAAMKANRQGALNANTGFAQKSYDETLGDWDNLGSDIFGADGNKQSDLYSGIEAKDAQNVSDLVSALGNWDKSSDFFKDPSFGAYVGDVQNKATRSDATKANQLDALNRFKALSSPTESAEERLMREQARREMESNMRGDREAMESRLRSRGVYGSGDELTSQLMSQGTTSANRSMELMQANANAQQRAIAALGKYSDVAQQMGQNELYEGSAANAVSQFNNGLKQQANLWKAGQQITARQSDNAEDAKRAGTIYGANADQTARERADNQTQISNKMGYATGKTTAQTGATTNRISAGKDVIDSINKDIAAKEANKDSGGFLSGIFG